MAAEPQRVASLPIVLTPIVVGGLHPTMTRLLRELRVGLRQTQRVRREVMQEVATLKPGVDTALAALAHLLETRLTAEGALDGITLGKLAELVGRLSAIQERYARMSLQLAKATDADARLHQLLSGEPDSRAAKALEDCSDEELWRIVDAAHQRRHGPPGAPQAVEAGDSAGG